MANNRAKRRAAANSGSTSSGFYRNLHLRSRTDLYTVSLQSSSTRSRRLTALTLHSTDLPEDCFLVDRIIAKRKHHVSKLSTLMAHNTINETTQTLMFTKNYQKGEDQYLNVWKNYTKKDASGFDTKASLMLQLSKCSR